MHVYILFFLGGRKIFQRERSPPASLLAAHSHGGRIYLVVIVFYFDDHLYRLIVIWCSDRANFFLNALVLYFILSMFERITFCRCFLIFNPAVFCVDDGVILWLKIKNPTTTSKLLINCHSFGFLDYSA